MTLDSVPTASRAKTTAENRESLLRRLEMRITVRPMPSSFPKAHAVTGTDLRTWWELAEGDVRQLFDTVAEELPPSFREQLSLHFLSVGIIILRPGSWPMFQRCCGLNPWLVDKLLESLSYHILLSALWWGCVFAIAFDKETWYLICLGSIFCTH